MCVANWFFTSDFYYNLTTINSLCTIHDLSMFIHRVPLCWSELQTSCLVFKFGRDTLSIVLAHLVSSWFPQVGGSDIINLNRERLVPDEIYQESNRHWTSEGPGY